MHGDEVTEENFNAHQKLLYGDTVESNYYNPYNETKGSRVVTEDVCYVCYFKDNIVDEFELMRHTEVMGKDPLTICMYCFDMDI